jgi:Gram-negative bacterial TonB protein C-terminal
MSISCLLYELDSLNSDVVEMDKLDARPKALFAPDPFDPIPLSRAEAEDVIIEFFIDPDGGVQLPRIVSAKNKERGWAAATAVKRWIFEVPKVNGKPVFVRRELALGFN